MRRYWPALVVLIICTVFVGWRLILFDGDPIAIAEIGTRFSEQDPAGSKGYDGQFSTFIALDPEPASVAPHLDVPAYRYQRILYPMLARLAAFGRAALIPWALVLVNLLAHTAATAGVADLLSRRDLPVSYALIYGLWVGLVAAVGLNLHEPLAYGLVVLAFVLRDRKRYVTMAIVLGLALFTKETTAAFTLAILIADLLKRPIDRGHVAILIAGITYAAWQIWLWGTFGMPGLGSGGELATPFEIIPFMGFFRIGGESIKALGIFALIFGPTVLIPTVYALIQGIQRLRLDLQDEFGWSSCLNAILIMVLPFSTFREPLGLVRIFTGVVLATLLLNMQIKYRRPLNYAYFWIPMLALLINQ